MRVLHINKAYDTMIGGIEGALQLLATEQSRYVPVQVLACNGGPRTEVEQVNPRLRITKVARWGTLWRMPIGPSLPWHLRRAQADILHLHHPFPLAEVSYLLTRPGGEVVISWHSDIVRQRWALAAYRPWLVQLLGRASRIIVASPNYLACSRFLGPFRHKCAVIPYGINLARFQLSGRNAELVHALRARYRAPVVLFVGRLVWYKGLHHLVRALAAVPGTLLLVGDGPLRSSLWELAARLGVAARLAILPQVADTDLPAYYHACDVFVLPSVENTEAFGIVQLEAMACGKPVVSTDLPTGVPFVNEHGRTGLVVPPRDSTALADALNTLLADPALRQQLGGQARQRVHRHFTKEAFARRVLELYEDVLLNGPAPDRRAPELAATGTA